MSFSVTETAARGWELAKRIAYSTPAQITAVTCGGACIAGTLVTEVIWRKQNNVYLSCCFPSTRNDTLPCHDRVWSQLDCYNSYEDLRVLGIWADYLLIGTAAFGIYSAFIFGSRYIRIIREDRQSLLNPVRLPPA